MLLDNLIHETNIFIITCTLGHDVILRLLVELFTVVGKILLFDLDIFFRFTLQVLLQVSVVVV